MMLDTTDRERLKQAQLAFEERNYPAAEAILCHLTEENTPFADAYSLLGMIHYRSGRYTKAIENFRRAIAINPNYLEALMYLSVIEHDLGRYKKGKTYEKKLDRAPKLNGSRRIATPFRAKLANMHAEIGDIYRGLGCHEDAILEYDRALSLEAHYPDIRLKRALSIRELDPSGNKAIDDIHRILTDCPRYSKAYLELGITHYMQKRFKEARAAWTKLKSLDPKEIAATVYLKMLDRSAKGKGAGAPEAKKPAAKVPAKKIPHAKAKKRKK